MFLKLFLERRQVSSHILFEGMRLLLERMVILVTVSIVPIGYEASEQPRPEIVRMLVTHRKSFLRTSTCATASG